MIITYRGQLREARILSSSRATMRIVAQGCDDALELSRLQDNWLSEDADAISFEFLEGPEIPLVFPETAALLYRLPAGQFLSNCAFGNALRC
jgi:hypothetical protein